MNAVATVLAHAILSNGIRNAVAGASVTDLRRGLNRATVAAELRAMSRPVRTRKEKAPVAAISVHNDAATGELVADTIEKVGNDGVITVEESKTTETTLEVVEGMQFDRGFLSHFSLWMPRRWRRCSRTPVSCSRTARSAACRSYCSGPH